MFHAEMATKRARVVKLSQKKDKKTVFVWNKKNMLGLISRATCDKVSPIHKFPPITFLLVVKD